MVRKYNLYLFLTGLFLILLAVYFRNTRTLIFISGALFFINLLFCYKALFDLIRKNIYGFIFLGLFLLFLIFAVIYSPYPSASFDDFLVSYFFYILLFLNLAIFWEEILEKDKTFWVILCIILGVNLIANLIFLICGVDHCKSNFHCYILWGLSGFNEGLPLNSIFHHLTRLSVIYTFNVCFFISMFFLLKNKIRWICFFLFIMNLIYLIWMGRRVALLGLFIGAIIAGFLFVKFRKVAFSILALILLLIGIIFVSSYKKDILIRSDKISILLSGDYQKFKEAGSLGKRLYGWPIYLKWAIKHPFKGTGLARRVQKKVLADIEKDTELGHAHNIFLNLWLQGGLQIAIVFTIFYFWLILKVFKILKNLDEREFYFFIFMFIFLVSFFVMSSLEGFEKETSFVPFWLGCGLVLGHEKYLAKNKFAMIKPSGN